MQTILYQICGNAAADRRALTEAGKIIATGGLVAFPTETVYGLGANALDAVAVGKIFAAKGRPGDNPLIVHLSEVSEAEALAYTTPAFYKIAAQFMPGPITVILKKKSVVPDAVTAQMDTVALRCPGHPAARMLIQQAGVPIAAPSANCSGKPSPTTAAHVIDDMDGRIDMILDGGSCEVGVESTVVKADETGITLLRPGAVTAEMIQAQTGLAVSVAEAVMHELKQDEKPLSPGMKYRHYAPKAPLTLLSGEDSAVLSYLQERLSANKKCAVLCYEEDAAHLSANEQMIILLGKKYDIEEHSRRIFSALREADAAGAEEIYAPLPSAEGLSLALYNRMIRAAAHRIIAIPAGAPAKNV